MKSQTSILLFALTALPVFAAEPAASLGLPGRVLLSDDFRAATKAERRPTRGEWRFENGVASCAQDDVLYKQFKDHGPAMWFDLGFSDAVIEFELKSEGCTNFVFTVNDEKGHVYRFVTGAGRTSVRAWPPELADHKSIASGTGKTGIEKLGEWTAVVVELKGGQSRVRLGGRETITAEHPAYAVPKTVIGLGFAFGKASFRNVRVRELR